MPLDLHALLTGDHGPKLQDLDTIAIRARFDERIRMSCGSRVIQALSSSRGGCTLRQVIAQAWPAEACKQAFPEGMRLNRPTRPESTSEQIKDMMIREQVAVTVDQQQISLIDPSTRRSLGGAILNEQNEIDNAMAAARATGRMAGINLVGILKSEDTDIQLEDNDSVQGVCRVQVRIRACWAVMVPGSLAAS